MNISDIIKRIHPDLIEGQDWSIVDSSLVWNTDVMAEPSASEIDGWRSLMQSEALVAISNIESLITTRRLIEAHLGIDNGWLAAKNTEITELRKALK